MKLVEPEAVAASPNRIKSPVPVYCGFDSVVRAVGNAPTWSCAQDRCLTFRLRSENGQRGGLCSHSLMAPNHALY